MKNNEKRWTIGQLARRVKMRTSALRYYEDLGLIPHPERTPAGYRLYDDSAEQILHFIQRAQQLGFSLADIQVLLKNWHSGNLQNDEVSKIAESRYLALEEQLTRTLVLQHELGLFLQDIEKNLTEKSDMDSQALFNRLLERVCANPMNQPAAEMFDWLLERTGCTLSSELSKSYLDKLRGKHIHVWQEEEGYAILVVGKDTETGIILQTIANLETNCQVHRPGKMTAIQMVHDEGYLLKVFGENAFIFARLFLSLEKSVGQNG